uniref:Uncharacterized protein n=1 Tax=Fusarium oxysporum (strain Fo5176) TaxID=660025 RepID=A0A0D2XL22_FUSOF
MLTGLPEPLFNGINNNQNLRVDPVASPNSNNHTELHFSLQRALGVCATACTLTDSTRSILDQMLETEMQHLRPIRESLENSAPLLLYDKPLHNSEIDSAYRTILISYLARSVHSALISQTCTLLAELGSLPVFIHSNEPVSDISYDESQQAFWSELRRSAEAQELNRQNKTISYNEFADRWSQQKELLGLNERDRFVVLLLAACKGVDTINGQA